MNLWTLSQFIRNKGCREEFWEFFSPRKWPASRRSFGRQARRCRAQVLSSRFFFCLLIFCMRRHMWNKVWFVASWWYLTYCNCKYKVHYSHVNVMSLHYIITPYQFVMQTLRELASLHMISIYLCSWQGDRLDEARKVWSCRIKKDVAKELNCWSQQTSANTCSQRK